MILGIDVSTAKIGLAVVDNDKNLVYVTVIKCKKDTLEEKAEELFSGALEEIKIAYPIEEVRIEEAFSLIRGGKTTANTMAKLQRFNGMVSYLVYKKFGLIPVLIGVRNARFACKIKIPKGTKGPALKKCIICWVAEQYPTSFKVEYTKQGNPKPGIDDMADAVVIALSKFNDN